MSHVDSFSTCQNNKNVDREKDLLGHCVVNYTGDWSNDSDLLLACQWPFPVYSATTDPVAHDICIRRRIISRPPGEMASRLTTNQEIAGSTPAVVI